LKLFSYAHAKVIKTLEVTCVEKLYKTKLEISPANSRARAFVASLFDKGLSSLTVLWSCNVMEEVTDVITDEIINRNAEHRTLFRKESDSRRYYPLQLKNLGYDFHPKCHTLWGVRNKIAHRNYEPTFDETKEAMVILTLFTQKTPTILKKWISP